MTFDLSSTCYDVVFSWCCCLITVIDLSSSCYDVVPFVVLLRCFIFAVMIQIGIADSMS